MLVPFLSFLGFNIPNKLLPFNWVKVGGGGRSAIHDLLSLPLLAPIDTLPILQDGPED